MEVLSRTRYVSTGKSVPKMYMSARQLAEYEELTPASVTRYIKEIQTETASGRYPKMAVLDSQPRKVNFFVYVDYMANRKRLRDKNLRKFAEPFNPAEIAQICPIVQEVIIATEE